MLIVVKNRNVELLLESLFDLETTRRRDVFEVDTAKRGRDRLHGSHDLVRIFRIQADRKSVDARKLLEQHRLPFHHRQGGGWTNVAETEYRRPVRDDGDRVFLDR